VCACSLSLIMRTLELGLPRPGRIGRTVLAATLLAAALFALQQADASLGVLIAAACVVYPALLFALRAFGRDDLQVLLRRATPA
jgi:hypothetical protein